MRKIISVLLFSICLTTVYGQVDSLKNASLIGQASRNQKVGQGFQIGFIGSSDDTCQINTKLQLRTGNPAAGKVLASDANGFATWTNVIEVDTFSGTPVFTSGLVTNAIFTTGGNTGYVMQLVNDTTGVFVGGPPTQVLYYANDSGITSSSLFTRTDTTTIISNAKGDTVAILISGYNIDGSTNPISGAILTDNNNFLFVNALTQQGLLVGDLFQNPYYLPMADGTNGQVLTTNGSGVSAWDDLPTPTVTGANNGTTLTGGNIGLGGTLNANTTVNQSNYSLSFTNNVFQSSIPLQTGTGSMALRVDTGTSGSYLGYFRNRGGAYFQVYKFDSTGSSQIRWIAEARSLYDTTHRFGISGFDDNVNMFQYNPVGALDVAQINIKLHKANIWTHDIGGYGSLIQADTNYAFIAPRVNSETSVRTSSVWYYVDSTGHEFNGAVQIVDGTEGNGKVLTSDASGNATWQALGSASYGGIPAYANNAAALVGGLVAGQLYYTDVAGEYILKIVH